jgi:putative RNA 2'-phosphotransferase
MNLETLSKTLSFALRHEPWLYELELDDQGWASLEAVLAALREERREWRELSRADLERLIERSEKRRFELDEHRIRALYGHSLPGKLRREPAPPPAILFHGTSPHAAKVIAEQGLNPMSRQYVHLSVDVPTAREVARRKSKTPVLFEIDARGGHEAGVAFYEGNDKVWLADTVPARFLREIG